MLLGKLKLASEMTESRIYEVLPPKMKPERFKRIGICVCSRAIPLV